MRIIILLSPSSRGKTTILNLVHSAMLKNGATSTARQPEGENPLGLFRLAHMEWKADRHTYHGRFID